MPEYTVHCCGRAQPFNSKWAPTPKNGRCRICGSVQPTWKCVYGPKIGRQPDARDI